MSFEQVISFTPNLPHIGVAMNGKNYNAYLSANNDKLLGDLGNPEHIISTMEVSLEGNISNKINNRANGAKGEIEHKLLIAPDGDKEFYLFFKQIQTGKGTKAAAASLAAALFGVWTVKNQGYAPALPVDLLLTLSVKQVKDDGFGMKADADGAHEYTVVYNAALEFIK